MSYFIDALMLVLSIVLWVCFGESIFLILGAIAILLAACVVIIDICEIHQKRKHELSM